MLTQNHDPQQHFEAVEHLLTRWLKERRALWGVYTEIVVTLDYSLDDEALEQRQKTLCELLVDYDVTQGRIWVLVPIVTAMAPWWMARVRGLVG